MSNGKPGGTQNWSGCFKEGESPLPIAGNRKRAPRLFNPQPR